MCSPEFALSAILFTDTGGEIYDPGTDSWSEMPTGMGDGWPMNQAETKLGAIADGKLYSLQPSISSDSRIIKIYDNGEDAWKGIAPEVPLRDFVESEFPYLRAEILGKLHDHKR